METKQTCPFLDTVDRSMLDFDMEKVCSVTLNDVNLYCCLICGKYFNGRGKNTPAYQHALMCNHYIFMNLNDTKTYCLPDNYEIKNDTSLNDIKYYLKPQYSLNTVQNIDEMNVNLIRDINSNKYLPGFIGLNNLGSTDYINTNPGDAPPQAARLFNH